MNHRQHRKHNKSMKRRLKRMAAAAEVAGAAFVSSALLPGVPATAHASALIQKISARLLRAMRRASTRLCVMLLNPARKSALQDFCI